MLITDFSNRSIDLGEAQFALGIALSQLGESAASVAVMGYLCVNVNENKGVQDILELRKDFEFRVLQHHVGMLKGVLLELDSTECLPKVSSGKRTKVIENVRLSDLLLRSTISQVYAKAMIMLSEHNANHLIVSYMDTKEYKEKFYADLDAKYSKSADGIRNNDLSVGVKEEIRKDFRTFIYRYSSDGTYSPATGTPLAFLRAAFNNMYSRGDAVYKILNTSGTNVGIGDDSSGLTALDFIGIEAMRTDNDFDFVDIANRINRASRLVFTHNNNAVAFYDIFSCYRDNLVHASFVKNKLHLENVIAGCSIEIYDSSNEEGRGHEGAVKNKKSGRVRLCRIFEPIITKGIAQDEILDYYKRAIELTDDLTIKDGVRLFSTRMQATKHKESNSEMLQIIISGYLAVRELIDYINRDDVETSLYSFPTIIFRNAEYLKRFQSLDEYVKNIDTVSYYVEQAAMDPKMSQTYIDGVYRNEEIWNYLGESNLLQDGIFKKLAEMPLGYIRSAVKDSKTLTHEQAFVRGLRVVTSEFHSIADYVAKNVCTGDTYMDHFRSVKKKASLVCGSVFKGLGDLEQYAVAFSFVNELKAIMQLEGNPVCDEQQNYLLCEPDSRKEFAKFITKIATPSTSQETLNALYKMAALRINGVAVCYNLFTGNDVNVCDWKQLREMFLLSDLLQKLILMFDNRLQGIAHDSFATQGIYLLLANIATDATMFKIPDVITSCDDVAFLYDGTLSPYYISDIVKDQDARMRLNDDRNKQIVTAVNRFLSTLGDSYQTLGYAFDLLDKYVSKEYAPIALETKLEKILQKAAYAMNGYKFMMQASASTKLFLEGNFDFDDLGYLLSNGERVVYDSMYVLKSGYAILPDMYNNTFRQISLTEDILRSIYYRVKGLRYGVTTG